MDALHEERDLVTGGTPCTKVPPRTCYAPRVIDLWLILAGVGVLLALAEVFTPSFFLLPAGLAFLAAAFVAYVSPGRTLALAALAGLLLCIYLMFYVFVWPRVNNTGAARTAASGMVGKIATVTEPIRADVGTGYVKLYGDTWRAVGSEPFDLGAHVVILATEGNKVIVGPVTSNER